MRSTSKKVSGKHGMTSRNRLRLSPQHTAQLLMLLFVGIPMAIALGIARWAGWDFDATLIVTMAGGVLGGVLLAAVVLGFSR